MAISVSSEISPKAVELRPELALVVAAGHVSLTPQRMHQIKALVALELDWSYVLTAAMKHRMVPLLYQSLHQACPGAIPTDVDRYLHRLCQVNTLKNLFLDHQLQDILAWFGEENIPAIAYKGPELAKLAYGSLSLRQFTDLDVLVRPQDFEAAQVVLRSHGYEASVHLGWEMHWISSDQQIHVDLHRALFPDFFAIPDSFIQPSHPLSPEDMLLVLAVQLGKDCCHWKLRISQICDIAVFLGQYPNLDFERVFAKAQTFGILRFLVIALILVQDFLAEPLPAPIQSHLGSKGLERRLANWVIHTIQYETDHPEIVPEDAGFWYFFRVYNHRFYLQVRERPRDKILYCAYWLKMLLRMSFRPNKADRDFISLPHFLGILYYPIHVIRLLLKYTRK